MRITTKTLVSVVSVILIIVILSYLAIYRLQKFVMKELSSFSEASLSDFSLDAGTRENVLEILKSAVVENEYTMGFYAGPDAGNVIIDPVATVHGVLLAKCAGSGIDRSKLQNYINECYRKTEEAGQPSDVINLMYYAVILDEHNNNYKISISDDFIQRNVDRVIKALKFGNDINNDIVSARKAVEIVMDLQIHGLDILLDTGQVYKIRKGLRKALDKEEIADSILLTDIYLTDHALNSGLVSEETLTEVYERIGDDSMYNAHRFMVCFDRAGIIRYTEEQMIYVRSHMQKTLESVFMGLSILKNSSSGGIKK